MILMKCINIARDLRELSIVHGPEHRRHFQAIVLRHRRHSALAHEDPQLPVGRHARIKRHHVHDGVGVVALHGLVTSIARQQRQQHAGQRVMGADTEVVKASLGEHAVVRTNQRARASHALAAKVSERRGPALHPRRLHGRCIPGGVLLLQVPVSFGVPVVVRVAPREVGVLPSLDHPPLDALHRYAVNDAFRDAVRPASAAAMTLLAVRLGPGDHGRGEGRLGA
eukprot:CAMPEP_0204211174 /NCGR_PEP_ID=MMETSP0361-20130328/74437_1 /ASSEMBLY_ACC=CAM_ASM_000343 /TAXON_ID=268821 /ORGANISM="Scrippsiella Hangoei, Strain SHTV-5" /LENGTH=224 /DNA_ID=CAMNT_0051175403 /DNA_START=264 /DNA_END=935 /DNA_ORIENTATION=-